MYLPQIEALRILDFISLEKPAIAILAHRTERIQQAALLRKPQFPNSIEVYQSLRHHQDYAVPGSLPS